MDTLARVMLASVFVITSTKSLVTPGGFEGFQAMVAKGGFPFPALMAVIALGVKLVAGSALAFGYQTKWAVRVLILFLAIATAVYHSSSGELTNALRNVAIMGGLLLV